MPNRDYGCGTVYENIRALSADFASERRLRAYERVEWSKAELGGWLIQQAYERMLRAMEQDREKRFHAVQAKTAIAELAVAAARYPGHRPSDIGTRMFERLVSCTRLGA